MSRQYVVSETPTRGFNLTQNNALSLHILAPPHDRDGTAGSEYEDDVHRPPKQKRRRQALSCTECKRRKIKCDRVQPCGPCSSRREQAKCKWYTIEPTEKFVTRAEYDDLETRFSHLEALFTRLSTTPTVPTPALSASSISLSKCELCMHTGLSSIATQTFKSAANHIHFNPSVIPPSNCMHLAELGRSARRHTQPDSRPPRCYPGPTTIQSTVLPAHLALPSSGRSPSDMTSPLEPYQQHSPLLPASIMSPYNFESQPKKDHALTLPLSERLLPGLSEGLLSPCEDPAMLLGSGRPRYKNKSVSASLARCITTHPGLVKDGAGNGTDTETDEHSASGSVCTYQR